ncbi:MAG: CDP-glycerol glycerophosphotransferase family protein [Bacteroides sp.]|nr:CDP-glycerol glycerophosphotransferase family protein [Prevotella sp.]MCM1407090.1 CDP-glycerol glycerophosphotransferase family protein [Treponema brennaborense]MCM1470242.1 CDP-glycerol glycerophosphotransferase family protein [Bacteroides sp.]
MNIKTFSKKILPSDLWNVMRRIHSELITLSFYVFRVFPVRKNKVVMVSFFGKGFCDNPKYIAEELLKQNEKYDFVWLVNDLHDKSFPEGIRLVKNNSLRATYEQVTAKVWIDNCRKPFWVRKRKNQFYIQTWHGDLPLKKIEKDVEDQLSKSGYVKNAKNDSKMADLMVAGTQWTADLYRKSFWYDGDIAVWGSPKSERLLEDSSDICKKVKDALDISNDTHLAMFAPTFRNTNLNYEYFFDYEKITATLEKRFSGKWTIIKRYHPNVSEIKRAENDSAIDATHYPDMQELLIAVEVLITDYSSTMFETIYNPRKVCFLYADDLSEYDRGFYFDLKTLPFSFSQNMCELEKNILGFDREEYLKKTMEQKKLFGFLEKPCGAVKCSEKIRNIVLKT